MPALLPNTPKNSNVVAFSLHGWKRNQLITFQSDQQGEKGWTNSRFVKVWIKKDSCETVHRTSNYTHFHEEIYNHIIQTGQFDANQIHDDAIKYIKRSLELIGIQD